MKSLHHGQLGRLVLRSMTLSDVDMLVAIEQRTHLTPWKREHFEGSLNGRHQGLVICMADQVLGYCIFSVLSSEAELLLLVVDAEYQGRGLGKQLLNAFIQSLDASVEQLFLEVRAGNQGAICLYEESGFNLVGERRNYYRVPWGREDALIYAMELAGNVAV